VIAGIHEKGRKAPEQFDGVGSNAYFFLRLSERGFDGRLRFFGAAAGQGHLGAMRGDARRSEG
jgi:hypothetical protein